MTNPIIKAWRSKDGTVGIAIAHMHGVGHDNVVDEIILMGDEVEQFVAACDRAWLDAQCLTETTDGRGLPGPYDEVWYRDD